jgi:hypothetical protein
MLICISDTNPRSRYIFRLIFGERLGMKIAFTGSAEEFRAFEGPNLCYGTDPAGEGIFIKATGLLSESGIGHPDINIRDYNGFPAFFFSGDERSFLPFDLFSAAFYLITRYEEYLPHETDKYGRFLPEQSIAFNAGFLDEPLVDRWILHLADLLKKNFPGIEMKPREYTFQPTIDIDHLFAFRGRGLYRTLGGSFRSLQHGDWRRFSDRFKVISGMKKDPYDVYKFLEEVHEPYGLNPFYFLLNASYGGDDNNIALRSGKAAEIVRALDKHGRAGIHPSLASNHDPGFLLKETEGLASVLGRPVTVSRQHFLLSKFPETFRNLYNMGISDDYSLGYAGMTGFRASTAAPFPFFDLEKNEKTALILHPVSVMDVTLKNYRTLMPQEANREAASIAKKVKAVNGELVSLWHNESLSEYDGWEGWREVYTEFLTDAV